MPYVDYHRIREIGAGSYGRAYLADAKGKTCVVKEVNMSKMQQAERNRAEGEVRVLSKLKHPYIVRYWESFIHDGSLLCIVMDFCDGGDLQKYIAQQRRQRSPIPEPQVLRWLTQMALALKYLHEDKRVLHRDIKTQNVFLVRKESGPLGAVKIADFGISKVLANAADLARTVTGTPFYLSPEICKKQPYACPSDMWALGCVLFELCVQHVPFEAQDLKQLVERIVRSPIPRLPPPYDCQDLLSELLERRPERRLTAAAALQKPRLQKEIQAMLAEQRGLPNSCSLGQNSHAQRPPLQDLNHRLRSPSPKRGALKDHSPQRSVGREIVQPRSARSPSPFRR